jgi:transcriptional regulator with XRE-family HTH domain
MPIRYPTFMFKRWMARADAEAFAERLRELRKASGMTQIEFAKRIGISLNTVSYWENARTQPMPEKMAKIASELGTSEDFLRTGAQSNGTTQPQKASTENVRTVVEEARQKIALDKGVQPSQVRISIDL